MHPRLSNRYFNFPSKNQGGIHWILQRVTGGLLVFLSVWVLISLFSAPLLSYALMYEWMACPCRAGGFMAFICLALWHGYLGMEVIIDDYVSNAFWHGMVLSLLRLSLGGGLFATIWAFFEFIL
ncbi:MAG: succinate dehydrogenase, hydrophobic membrane anchor protein [Alphaproteobacteria bacterium]|nr:succinate dehydrogenase, hydrophobic membrane anchor protein [Alphaproteobacteria bacterium]